MRLLNTKYYFLGYNCKVKDSTHDSRDDTDKIACQNLFGLMLKGETHCIVSKLRNCEIAKLPELAKLPKLAKLAKLVKLAKLAKFLFKFIRSFGITDYKILI